MPFHIIRQDICKMNVDAIVNAANTSLIMGGGVCGAIFHAAGALKLQEECNKIGRIETGQAVMTSGYALPAKYIIHTAGPVYQDGQHGEAEQLRSCYSSSLELAEKNGLTSIAFPLISSGIYGYPKKEAFGIAVDAIKKFLENSDMTVYLLLFNIDGLNLAPNDVKLYVDSRYVKKAEKMFSFWRSKNPPLSTASKSIASKSTARNAKFDSVEMTVNSAPAPKKLRSLEELIDLKTESFSQRVLRLIDERGLKDSDVYKRANLDRKLFSKIRCDNNYKPSKNTALALSIALKLNLDDTLDLLKTAGYTLSNSSYTDLIVRYHIEHEIYDIFAVNFVLFDYNEEPLGSKSMCA